MPPTELVTEFYIYIKSLNTSTMFTIVVLVGLAGMILKYTTDSGLMTSMFVMGFQAGAFLLNFIFMKLNIALFASPDTNLIAISTIGMILGLFVMIFAMRTGMALADATRTKPAREGTSTIPSTIPRR